MSGNASKLLALLDGYCFRRAFRQANDAPAIRHFRTIPRVVSKSTEGAVLPPGRRTCQLKEEGRDLARLRMWYNCSADDEGVVSLHSLVIIGGGSTRQLHFTVLLDGIAVTPANDSWWKFDTELHYLSSDMLSYTNLNVVFLIGHDSFRLMALLVSRDGFDFNPPAAYVRPRAAAATPVCESSLCAIGPHL